MNYILIKSRADVYDFFRHFYDTGTHFYSLHFKNLLIRFQSSGQSNFVIARLLLFYALRMAGKYRATSTNLIQTNPKCDLFTHVSSRALHPAPSIIAFRCSDWFLDCADCVVNGTEIITLPM